MRKDTVTTLSIALFFIACIAQAVANIYVTICTTNVATVSKRHVIHDSTLNCNRLFLEETAGITGHPAQYLKSSGTGVSTILLKKTGVSDPEGIKCNGHTVTASALRKLAPAQTNMPDLVIYHSHNAVPEYNNPDLILGMFPSLFPFSIAGFEDPEKTVRISFQAHANAQLDVPNHSFHHHHTFMFVILNIIQRRTGHLQAHFTVQNSQFDDVAKKNNVYFL